MDDIISSFDRPLTLISVLNIFYFTLNILGLIHFGTSYHQEEADLAIAVDADELDAVCEVIEEVEVMGGREESMEEESMEEEEEEEEEMSSMLSVMSMVDEGGEEREEEEEGEASNGGFKVQMVEFPPQFVVGTGTYSVVDDDEDELDARVNGMDTTHELVEDLVHASSSFFVQRNQEQSDVSMCNVSGLNVNVPSTPSSISRDGGGGGGGGGGKTPLARMRDSLRKTGIPEDEEEDDEEDDEEHDGTTEPELSDEDVDLDEDLDVRASLLMEAVVNQYVEKVEVERRLKRDVRRLDEIQMKKIQVTREVDFLRASLRRTGGRRVAGAGERPGSLERAQSAYGSRSERRSERQDTSLGSPRRPKSSNGRLHGRVSGSGGGGGGKVKPTTIAVGRGRGELEIHASQQQQSVSSLDTTREEEVEEEEEEEVMEEVMEDEEEEEEMSSSMGMTSLISILEEGEEPEDSMFIYEEEERRAFILETTMRRAVERIDSLEEVRCFYKFIISLFTINYCYLILFYYVLTFIENTLFFHFQEYKYKENSVGLLKNELLRHSQAS